MREMRYINPLTDFGFKKIFGDEEIMRDFLNDIIEPKSPIKTVQFLDKEMPPETKYERGVIYDMRCRLEDGEEVLVEMQNRGQDYFRDRICYYMARAVSTQGERGNNEWKFHLHPVYGVFFMNFHLKEYAEKKTEEMDMMEATESAEGTQMKANVEKQTEDHDIRHIALADVKTREVFSDKLQMWLIELPRYRRMQEADCKINRDYWLYTLTHMETMTNYIPFQTQKPIFRKLENMADLAALTPDERNHYNISLDSFRTNLAVMDHERNMGRAEGRAEGLMLKEREMILQLSHSFDSLKIASLLNMDVDYVNEILKNS